MQFEQALIIWFGHELDEAIDVNIRNVGMWNVKKIKLMCF